MCVEREREKEGDERENKWWVLCETLKKQKTKNPKIMIFFLFFIIKKGLKKIVLVNVYRNGGTRLGGRRCGRGTCV